MNIKNSVKVLGISLISVAILLGGCTRSEANTQTDLQQNSDYTVEVTKDTPIATIKVKDFGIIEVALLPEIAPNTVNNFVSLANSGFYDGLIFHRIIDGFMLQGGDPEGTGGGGPGYSIQGEFSNNNFEGNTLKHKLGVLSMARSIEPDSAGSQFFVMTGDASHLDGEYAAFGQVIEGIDKVEQIGKVETDPQDRPKKDVIIESIKVDTKGKTYAEPNKIEN